MMSTNWESRSIEDLSDDEASFDTRHFYHNNYSSSGREQESKYMPTIWIFLAQETALIASYAALYVPFGEDSYGYFVIVSLYVAVWLALVMVYRLVHSLHRSARKEGFLMLYRRTATVIRVPFYVWGAEIAITALVFVYVPANTTVLDLSARNWLQIFYGIGMVLITIATAWYCSVIFKHNRAKLAADASEHLGLHDSKGKIIDKQAELIRYLTEQKHELSRKIVKLTQAMENLEASGGGFSKADMDYMVAAKENELNIVQGQLEKMSALVQDYQSKNLDTFEMVQEENARGKKEREALEDRVAVMQKENAKLKLLYETEKDGFAQAQEEIDYLKEQIHLITGKPLEEVTVYD